MQTLHRRWWQSAAFWLIAMKIIIWKKLQTASLNYISSLQGVWQDSWQKWQCHTAPCWQKSVLLADANALNSFLADVSCFFSQWCLCLCYGTWLQPNIEDLLSLAVQYKRIQYKHTYSIWHSDGPIRRNEQKSEMSNFPLNYNPRCTSGLDITTKIQR